MSGAVADEPVGVVPPVPGEPAVAVLAAGASDTVVSGAGAGVATQAVVEVGGAGSGEAPLPDVAQRLLADHPRIRNLFAGKRVGGVGADGEPINTPERYDRALVGELVRKKIRDPDIIAAVLRRRPDGHAAAQGDMYIPRTIADAMRLHGVRAALGGEAAHEPVELPFALTSILSYRSDPPTYELVIGGVTIPMTSAQLLNRDQFKQRVTEMTHRLPRLPSGKGSVEEWDTIVEAMLARCVLRELPAEGTNWGALRIAVEAAIWALPLGEVFGDVAHGRAFEAPTASGGKIRMFQIRGVLDLLATHRGRAEREDVSRILASMVEVTHGRPYFVDAAGTKVRASTDCYHLEVPVAEAGAQSVSPGGEASAEAPGEGRPLFAPSAEARSARDEGDAQAAARFRAATRDESALGVEPTLEPPEVR